MCAGVEQISGKWLQLGGDSLLHVGVCCKLLASQEFIKGSKQWKLQGVSLRLLGRVEHKL